MDLWIYGFIELRNYGTAGTEEMKKIMIYGFLTPARGKMFDPTETYGQGEGSQRIADKNERYISSESLSFKEDSDEIDALLSVEEEEDDVMSTGRTPSNNSYNSPDSDSACSKYGKQRCGGDERGEAGDTITGDRKKARVKKMVKVLRGIVPGGRQMDTPAFLDEAVKYLKSLKMEAKKLGIQNSNNLN